MNNTHMFDCFRSLALDEDVEGMGAMLDAGYDVNATNHSGETVFSHCCANNRLRAAKFLVRRGAEVNSVDRGGSTPLDSAARHASREFRDWLARIGGRENGRRA